MQFDVSVWCFLCQKCIDRCMHLHIHPYLNVICCALTSSLKCWKFSMKTSSAIHYILIYIYDIYWDVTFIYFFTFQILTYLSTFKKKRALIAYLCCWLIIINLCSQWCLLMLRIFLSTSLTFVFPERIGFKFYKTTANINIKVQVRLIVKVFMSV